MTIPTAIVGRADELAAMQRFLAEPADRLTVLVLEGQSGIGKSALWRAAVATARELGHKVVASKPAEAERTLPNVVLGDLFGALPRDVVEGLSEPRRRALDAALLRSEVGQPVDSLALNVAVRTVIERLAATDTLVIAIDDEQWVDASSRAALRFALRRLPDIAIRLLLARRPEEASAEWLGAGLDEAETSHLVVGPISLGAMNLLIRDRLGAAPGRRLAIRVHEASGGNPFYGLELARAISTMAPDQDPAAPLPLPATLDAAVTDRLEDLDAEVVDLLLLAALAGRIAAPMAEALGLDERLLDRAVAGGLLEQSNATFVFSHPLLASAVYRRATEEDRRAAHARLASASTHPVDQSRHLARASPGPDPKLAERLEREAAAAWRSGQAFGAAELAEQALRLTPANAGGARHRRILAAARADLAIGDVQRAHVLSEQALAKGRSGPERSEALVLASELVAPVASVGLLEEALAASGGTPALGAEIHARLASAGRVTRERGWTVQHAELAFRLAEELDDEALRATALSVLVPVRFDQGTGEALALAQRAYDIGRKLGEPRVRREATIAMAHILAWSGDPDRARPFLEAELAGWSDRDEEARASLLWYLSLVDLWTGRWEAADGHARESLAIGADYGIELPQHHLPIALLALHRGDFPSARDASERALALTDEGRLPAHRAVLAIADAWTGETAAALDGFAGAEAAADARSWDEPALRHWRGEYAETLVHAGRLEDAVRLVGPWEADAERLGRRRVIAQARRARGHIAAARGELGDAARLLEQAAVAHAAAHDPFGRARAMLALGGVRRRDRKKAAARQALREAVAGFAALGAVSWEKAARDELARIGGRQRILGLSESELRVAELVAAGRTNREIAQALYLGERTVASHLTHAYAKLGVRSRTELARHVVLQMAHEESEFAAGKVPRS